MAPKVLHIKVIYKAGTTQSGNFQHAGRPGLRGGSKPKSGAPSKVLTPLEQAKRDRFNAGERERWRAYGAAIKSGMSEAGAQAVGLQARDAARIQWDKDNGGVAAYANALAGIQQGTAAAPAATPNVNVAPPKPKFRDGLFADVDLSDPNVTADDIFAASSPEVQGWAKRTGFVATDMTAFTYIKDLDANGYFDETASSTSSWVKKSASDVLADNTSNMTHYFQSWGYFGTEYHTDPVNGSYLAQSNPSTDMTHADRVIKKLDDTKEPEQWAKDIWARDHDFDNWDDAVDAMNSGRASNYQIRYYKKVTDDPMTHAGLINSVAEQQISWGSSHAHGLDKRGFVRGINAIYNAAQNHVLGNDDHSQLALRLSSAVNQARQNLAAKGVIYDAPAQTSIMGKESTVVDMVNMYKQAAAAGKWPVYDMGSGTTPSRWQRMTVDQKKRLQDDVNAGILDTFSMVELQAYHEAWTKERPQLYNISERFFLNGADHGHYKGNDYVVEFEGSRQATSELGKKYQSKQSDTVANIVKAHSVLKEEFPGMKVDDDVSFAALVYTRDMNTAHDRSLIQEAAHRFSVVTQFNDKLDDINNSYKNKLSDTLPDYHIRYGEIDWDAANNIMNPDTKRSYNQALDLTLQKLRNALTSQPAVTGTKTKFAGLSTVDDGTLQWMKDRFVKKWDNIAHSSFSATIRNMFKVIPNKERKTAYETQVAKHDNEFTRPSFHASCYAWGASIAQGGFIIKPSSQASAGRMLGDGVYTTIQPSKACQYVRASANGSGFSRGSDTGPVLVLKVASGKTFDIGKTTPPSDVDISNGFGSSSPWHRLRDKYKYDSVYAPKGAMVNGGRPLVNSEHVTFNSDNVLVNYWLDVKRS